MKWNQKNRRCFTATVFLIYLHKLGSLQISSWQFQFMKIFVGHISHAYSNHMSAILMNFNWNTNMLVRMSLYLTSLAVTLWRRLFWKTYGFMFATCHKVHQTVSCSLCSDGHVARWVARSSGANLKYPHVKNKAYSWPRTENWLWPDHGWIHCVAQRPCCLITSCNLYNMALPDL